MLNTNLPLLESNTKCTLKLNDIVRIPIHEKMTAKLFTLLANKEKQNKIRGWLDKAGIQLIQYNEVRHVFKPSNEFLIDTFWHIINKVVQAKEEFQLTFYRNIISNAQKRKDGNWEEIKSFIDIVANYPRNHIEVLKLIDGIMDYFLSINLPTTNTIPPSIAHCIEFAVMELSGKHAKYTQIWNDLLELGLRNDFNLHRRITVNMFARMSLTSDLGKKLLQFISSVDDKIQDSKNDTFASITLFNSCWSIHHQ